jgi:chromosome segregation ATPase
VSDEEKRKFEACKAALEAAKLDLKALEDDQEMLEATIEVKTKRRDALVEREKDAAKRRSQEESLTAEIGKAQRDLDTTKANKGDATTAIGNRQTEFDAIKTAIEKLGVAVSTAGEKLSSMSNDYIKIAENQRERVKELFKVLLEKQDAEREILGEVKEVALRLENIGTSIDSAEVTISALFQVVAAMKQVVAILHEARLFWQNMSKACEELANPAFKTQIETYATKYPTLDRVKMFYDRASFKEILLKYLAKWRALEVIAEEYIDATKGVRSTVVDNFKILLVGQAAKDKVKELSARLLGQVANDIEALNDETRVVNEAMKAA